MEVNTLPAVIQPKAIYSPHPLSAGANRALFYCAFEEGESVSDYLVRNNIYPVNINNFILSINDVRLSVEQWDVVFPKNSDLITLRACVHGGGDGGSDPIRTIATIAVLVASQGTAGAALGTALGTTAAVGSALGAAGGMLLVNAVIPFKPPRADDRQPSPTYSLSGSANRARLFEPLPLVFGVHRMYPDHGAKPFTSFSGSDQKLIQVFNFGLSDLVLSDYKIGDTPLSTFDGVDIEESAGNSGVLNNFPTNVDSISGGDLIESAGAFITKTTSLKTTKIGVDISGYSYYVSKKGRLGESRIFLTIEYRSVGSSVWLPLHETATFPIINESKEILRLGYERIVPEGQYEVRVMLEDNAWHIVKVRTYDEESEAYTGFNTVYVEDGLASSRQTQVLKFEQLKSFQPADDTSYQGQKRVSLSIKANGQLSGRVDAFNALVSASYPVWNGLVWVTQVTSNPAWQFLALARGAFEGAQRIWGAGLPDARIDIDAIKLWGSWCDLKGLSCNLVFDGRLNVDVMLNTIARCGRATSTWASGKLGVIFDEANKPATAVFGMANIIRHSFRVNYLTGKLADEIIVAFTNPDIGYQRDTVSALVPGIVNPVNSVTLPLQGITDKAQAGKEANLIAAEQFYRRRSVSWESDMEGLAVQRGDVAILSHDLTQWGYSGRLVAGSVTALTLDREVPFLPATEHYIGIRFPDGSYSIYDVQLATGEQSIINLLTPLPSAPDDDVDNKPIDYIWVFEPKATPGKQVKITDIQPLSQNRVKISATDEDDAYYLAENNSYTYVGPGGFTDRLPTISDLQISETLISVGTGFVPKVAVSWNIDGEYGGAFIRAKDEDNQYKDVGRTLDRRFEFEWSVDKTITVEVVAFNLQQKAGPNSKAVISLLLEGQKKRPADVAGFSALQNGESVILKWQAPLEIDLNGTEIRYGMRGSSTWEDATPLTETTKGTNITSQDVPDGDWTFFAKHMDTSLNQSTNAATSDVLFSTDNDIIDQVEEAPNWTGVLTNFVLHHTGVLVPSSQGDTIDLGWRVFDEFVPDPVPICTYEANQIDIGFDDTVRISGDIQSALRGNTGGVANPTLSIDYKKDADAFDGFEDWSIGNALCQQVKHKLTLDTSVGVAIITGFKPTVDLKERTDKELFPVSAGGSTVAFAKAFHRPPLASAEMVSVDSGTAAFSTVTNVTETQAEIHNYNLSNTDAGGEALLTLTGV